MKVVLRADASSEIGTGHVMRQVALAEELLLQGAEVFLVGEVEGPSWLEDKLTSVSGLQRLGQPLGTFQSGVLQELGASASVVDSYALGQSDLAEWESQCLRTLVFVDGPWQRLHGREAIVSTLNDNVPWIGSLRKNFCVVHSGPEFLMIRGEIKRAKHLLLQNPPSSQQILVVLGGSDPRGLTAVIEDSLLEFASDIRVVIVGRNDSTNSDCTSLSKKSGLIHAPRSSFVEELTRSTLVISAAGTTSGELLFLGIPSIFIPVVDNQAENARALEKFRPATVLWPDSPNFQVNLVGLVAEALNPKFAEKLHQPTQPTLDGFGTRRIATLLLGQMVAS